MSAEFLAVAMAVPGTGLAIGLWFATPRGAVVRQRLAHLLDME